MRDEILRAVSPTTGQVLTEHAPHGEDEVEARLSAARDAFLEHRRSPLPDRARLLRGVAAELRRRRDELATLMAREMGKPFLEGRAEVDKCAWVAEHYADHGAAALAREAAPSDATESFVSYQPLGVVLAVMPWNFPLWQVFRFAAPALMAGNAAVLKHASNVPGCAIAIEEIFRSAGAPPGLFATLLVGSGRVAGLIADPRIAAVTLTGSTPAGRAVAAAAGRALKKTVLELGGSDPFVVLGDADLDAAAAAGARSRLLNGGQSCIAAKRFIVVEAVRDAFLVRLTAAMESAVMGDPEDPATTLGPQARRDLRDELADQVARSVEAGAEVTLGGQVPPGPGAFYPATILVNVGEGNPAFDEELFGPVAAVISAEDEEDAIRLANATSFGLGAAVFTGDVDRGRQIAEVEFEAGACFVNEMVKSDPRLPFGGVKDSGYGRELGVLGIREFVNVKTVYVK